MWRPVRLRGPVSRSGVYSVCRRPSWVYCPRLWRVSIPSNSVAARATSRPGWHVGERDRSASTTLNSNYERLDCCRLSTDSASRSTLAMRRQHRLRTTHSTSRSRSTVPASGVTPTSAPGAARILRLGGELIFLVSAVVAVLCLGDLETDTVTTTLARPQRGMHVFDWPDDDSVEFHLSHGEQLRLLRECGFEAEQLLELYAPVDATTRYTYMTAEGAAQWPVEEVWRAPTALACVSVGQRYRAKGNTDEPLRGQVRVVGRAMAAVARAQRRTQPQREQPTRKHV